MSNLYGFSSREDLNRALAAVRASESIGIGGPTQETIQPFVPLYAKVIGTVTNASSGETEVKAKQVEFKVALDGKLTAEELDSAVEWDSDSATKTDPPNIILLPGQKAPAVDEIIKPYPVPYDFKKGADDAIPADVKLPDQLWAFEAIVGGGGFSFFQAVVTAYYADGFVANIYDLNQTVIEEDPDAEPPEPGTEPIASNQQVPFGVPGAPTYLEIGQALVVMQSGLTFLPLGHITI